MLGKSSSFVSRGSGTVRQRAASAVRPEATSGHSQNRDDDDDEHGEYPDQTTRVNTPEDDGTLGVISASSFAINMCSEFGSLRTATAVDFVSRLCVCVCVCVCVYVYVWYVHHSCPLPTFILLRL